MRVKRGLRIVAGLATAGLVLGACSGGGSGGNDSAEPKAGGTLTIGTEQPWKTNPNASSSFSAWTTNMAIFDQLLYAQPNGDVDPGLAESYEVLDGGKKYVVKLREGLTFHDGTPLNAEAVKFSVEHLLKPETASTQRVFFQSIDTVDAVDERTVEFNLKTVDAAFLRNALGGAGSGPVSPTAMKKLGADFDKNPVGAGAFKFVAENPGQELKLEKFDKYWKPGSPRLDAVTFKFIADPQARFQSLQSGAIDVAQPVDPKSLKAAEGNKSITVSHVPGVGNYLVSLNMTQKPFDDIRARQAVCAAADPKAINKAAYLGFFNTDVNSSFGPEHPFRPEGELDAHVTYDADRAKKLVDELGGLEFTLTVGTVWQPIADALVSQWAAAGIKATVKTIEPAIVTDTALTRKYQAMPYRYQGDSDPDRNVSAYFAPDGYSNTAGLDDPETTKLIREGRATMDESKRAEIYARIAERVAELTPVCWLFSNDVPLAWSSKVHGIPDSPRGIIHLADAYLEN